MRAFAAARDVGRNVVWFVRSVMGDDAYEKYRAHYEAQHSGHPPSHQPLTEREFWRDRTDRQDAHPEGRCC
jgi:uncharacterized short protein YbdD (DUF466 family)